MKRLYTILFFISFTLLITLTFSLMHVTEKGANGWIRVSMIGSITLIATIIFLLIKTYLRNDQPDNN